MKNQYSLFNVLVLTLALSMPVLAEEGHNHGKTDRSATTFDTITMHYEAIHEALVEDSIEGVASHAEAIATAAGSVLNDFNANKAGVAEANAGRLQELLPVISRSATSLAGAKDLSSARDAFGDLSRNLVQYREMATGERPKVAYCPMAKKPWLQDDSKIANPYYGSNMLRCGSIVSE